MTILLITQSPKSNTPGQAVYTPLSVPLSATL